MTLPNMRYERFAHEYVVDGIGSRAAIRAGYPTAHARRTAARLILRPDIMARIAELQAEAITRAKLSKDEVIAGLRKAAALLDAGVDQRKGTAGASVRALELLGKEQGMFKDVMVLEHHNMSDDALVARIAEANPELAGLIAKMLGESSPLANPTKPTDNVLLLTKSA